MKRVLILTDGKQGLRNQALGLAEAVGFTADTIDERVVERSGWLRALVSLVRPDKKLFEELKLTLPWPELIIAAGHAAFPVAARLQRVSTVVAVQNPGFGYDRFDLVVVGVHDGVAPRSNVVVIDGACHRVVPDKIALLRDAARARFGGGKIASVLIGGPNKRFRFDESVARDLGAQLRGLAEAGWNVRATASRRTPIATLRALQDAAGPDVWLWDGTGENPYFDLLAAADALLVTSDSISMVSEAASLGRPVYLARLPGNPGKYGAFLDHVVARGSARWFDGTLDDYAQVKLDFAPAIWAVQAKVKKRTG
ncbi:mitochondrial fission ELM1 family protein [Roseiterribacter gracilis]|uniref:Nucleoside-diphosphate sugar epimerase n=1 Tax=Roseiterribacter gracilis TaxID=2812848 RepID=A0A8S8XDX8_9PROT|nr:hypothetical protein TMPK1_16830 [Rhodospirillales bacterium TMPK1]